MRAGQAGDHSGFCTRRPRGGLFAGGEGQRQHAGFRHAAVELNIDQGDVTRRFPERNNEMIPAFGPTAGRATIRCRPRNRNTAQRGVEMPGPGISKTRLPVAAGSDFHGVGGLITAGRRHLEGLLRRNRKPVDRVRRQREQVRKSSYPRKDSPAEQFNRNGPHKFERSSRRTARTVKD